MLTEIFTPQDYRDDSMSIKSGIPVTLDTLNAARNAHPELHRSVKPGKPSGDVYSLMDSILKTS